MYLEKDIVAASTAAGPHFDPPKIDPAHRSTELETILSIANASRPGLEKMGMFSLAPAREDFAYEYLAQIRATRKRSKGGFEFRFDVPAQDTGNQDVARTAEQLVKAARLFASLTKLKPYHESVRRMVDTLIEPATGGLVPMRVVALGITPTFDDLGIKLTVDVEMLGHDLRPGIDRVSGHDDEIVEKKLDELVERHRRREKLRSQALASRATGWLDDVALRVLQAAHIPVAEAVALLRNQQDLEFCFGGQDGWESSAALFWDEGVVRADVRQIGGREWELNGGALKINTPGLPELAIAALPGRRLSHLMELPLIPADSLITAAQSVGSWLWVNLSVGSSLIDERTGSANPAPRAG